MGTYLWAAVQEQWPPSEHSARSTWDDVCLFYFWKDYDLQERLHNLYDDTARDESWPRESRDSWGYRVVAPKDLPLLRQHTPDKRLSERFDALQAAAVAITRNPVRILFWFD